MLQDRGEWPEEEGELMREFKAMHEGNFLSSWQEQGRNNKR